MNKKYSMRGPRYGELQVLENVEAAKIYRSRNDEVDFCEPDGLICLYESDVFRDEAIESGRALWALASQVLSPRLFLILKARHVDDMTLDDLSVMLGVTRESARRLYFKALSKLKTAISSGSNPEIWK